MLAFAAIDRNGLRRLGGALIGRTPVEICSVPFPSSEPAPRQRR
jgi:hypothetical protein